MTNYDVNSEVAEPKSEPKIFRRGCNLCGREIRARHPFARFCSKCKDRNEVYRSAEWQPVSRVA
jgi:hypothetical protein